MALPRWVSSSIWCAETGSMLTRRTTGLGDMPALSKAVTLRQMVQGGALYVIPPASQAANAIAVAQQQAAAAQQALNAANAPAFNPNIGTPSDTIFGLPKMLVYIGSGAVGLFVLFKMMKGSPASAPALPVHQNPARRRNPERVPQSERLKRAVESYESFHWGDKPTKFLHKKISKTPRVGVKLGKLVSVAYETHKNGEHAVWEHEFGEEGGKRPDLVMDADNKRLHIVGGSYDVRPEGIID